MACIVMAYIVMVYIVMAYIGEWFEGAGVETGGQPNHLADTVMAYIYSYGIYR